MAFIRGPGSTTFPFYVPMEALPAPLPTIAEMIASNDLFPCIFEKRYICRVGEHFLVKYGRVKLEEAENMQVNERIEEKDQKDFRGGGRGVDLAWLDGGK